MTLEVLTWAAVLGLALDIVGFLLVIKYGHSLFLWAGAKLPPKQKNDVLYLYGGELTREDVFKRRRFWAKSGVVIVVIGFGFQIVGAVAAIQLSN